MTATIIVVLLCVAAVVFMLFRHRTSRRPVAAQAEDGRSTATGFNAEREIVIKYFDGDRQVTEGGAGTPPLRVITEGLVKHGRLEFELLGVPAALNNAAALLLNRIAEYGVNKKQLNDGDTWASRLPEGFVVAARVHSVESHGQHILRICDVTDEHCDQPAKTAVCAVAVSDALAKHEGDREDDATRILKASIEWFPGEVGAGMRVNHNENVNQNNNLAYFALATMHVDAEKNYAAAIERSEDLLTAELGSPMPPVLGRETLEKDAASIVGAVQGEMATLQNNPQGQQLMNGQMANGIGFLLSPIMRFVGGQLRQFLAIGPSTYRRYFYEPPVRDTLRDERVARLAAEIYSKWATKPGVVLVLSRDTAVGVYEDGYRFQDDRPSKPSPRIATEAKGLSHLPMLSRILASIGRELAAGLTLDEIRARWKIDDDQPRRVSSERKLAALREREDDDIRRSYGFQQ